MSLSGFRLPVVLIVACFVGLVGLAPAASAHEPGTSAIEIRPSFEGVAIQIDLPVVELGDVLGEEVPTETLALSQKRGVIADYIVDNLTVTGTDGEVMEVTGGRLTTITIDGVDFLRAQISARGDASGPFVLAESAILESDDSHRILVAVIGDDSTVAFGGTIDAQTPELTLSFDGEQPAASEGFAGSGFWAMAEQGYVHVLDGADHLLFLLTLLLPAPLVVVGRRWRRSDDGWRAARKVVHLVTAFTIGHSVSLAAVALGWVTLPTRPIEILIAVSVGVSALHALRPIARGGELPIAAGFGLVHGLAFGEILNNLGLDGASTARTLLAFNLGIEAAQLLTIAVTFPSLWLLSRTSLYPAVRTGGALVALAASVAWAVDRLGWAENPFDEAESWAVEHKLFLVVALGLLSVIAWLMFGFARRTAKPQNHAQDCLP